MVNGVLLRMHGVKSFYADVLPVLEKFELFGMSCKGSDDYPEAGRRTFEFGEHIRLMVFVDSNAEAGACRVVETGELAPVKKIVCA